MNEPTPTYTETRRASCKWCALHLEGDKKVTDVLPQSRPTPVHKVYPPHVEGRFSAYLDCTAPSIEVWATETTRERDRLKAELEYIQGALESSNQAAKRRGIWIRHLEVERDSLQERVKALEAENTALKSDHRTGDELRDSYWLREERNAARSDSARQRELIRELVDTLDEYHATWQSQHAKSEAVLARARENR